jgi:hypothetical protein
MVHRTAVAMALVGILACAQLADAGQAVAGKPVQNLDVAFLTLRQPGSREITGHLVGLEPDKVVMLVGGERREYRLDSVLRLQREGDSVLNGALIGVAVGAVLCAIVCGQGMDSDDSVGGTIIVNAGLSALIGMGIDAGHKGRTTLYPTDTFPAVRPRVAPSVVFRIRF